MRVQLDKFGIFQSSKLIAVIAFLFSAVIFIPVGLFMLFQGRVMQGVTMLLLPLVYLIFSFIFYAFFFWVYNVIASFVGGFEFTLSQQDQEGE